MQKKILFVSTLDSYGGASEWIYTMAKTLHDANFIVALLVKEKNRNDCFIYKISKRKKKKNLIGKVIKYFYSIIKKEQHIQTKPEYAFFQGEDETKTYFSINEIIQSIPFSPDIIISGLTYGFINTKTLMSLKHKTGASVFLTAYDDFVFTGGCHIRWGCAKFAQECTQCPGLIDTKHLNFTSTNLKTKKSNIKDGEFGILISSYWSYEIALKSKMFNKSKITNIGSCIDTDLFSNSNRNIAKQIFGFKQGDFVILSGSTNVKDKRKGSIFFFDALELLKGKTTQSEQMKIKVLLIGNNSKTLGDSKSTLFENKFIDFIKDYRLLSLAYQAADIFVSTTIDDAGPLMVSEALSCGTPVIGFSGIGLLGDDKIIKDGINGFRVKPKDTIDVADTILKIIRLEKSDYINISKNARTTVLSNLSQNFFISQIQKLK